MRGKTLRRLATKTLIRAMGRRQKSVRVSTTIATWRFEPVSPESESPWLNQGTVRLTALKTSALGVFFSITCSITLIDVQWTIKITLLFASVPGFRSLPGILTNYGQWYNCVGASTHSLRSLDCDAVFHILFQRFPGNLENIFSTLTTCETRK